MTQEQDKWWYQSKLTKETYLDWQTIHHNQSGIKYGSSLPIHLHQIKYEEILSVCLVYIRLKNAPEIPPIWLPDGNAMNYGPIRQNLYYKQY